MLACELGLAGIRPVLLDSLPGPNPQARVNRIVGQAARILDHRGLYSALSGADNRYIIGAPDADVHALIGRWVPDFAVTNDSGTRRVAELARSGRPLLLDLTDRFWCAPMVMWRGRRRRRRSTPRNWQNCVGFSRGGSVFEPLFGYRARPLAMPARGGCRVPFDLVSWAK